MTTAEGQIFAEQMAHPPSIGHSLVWMTNLMYQRREAAETVEFADHLLRLAEEHAMQQYVLQAASFKAWAEHDGHYDADAVQVLETLHKKGRSLGHSGIVVFQGLVLAEAYNAVGRHDDTMKIIGEAIETARQQNSQLRKSCPLCPQLRALCRKTETSDTCQKETSSLSGIS